MALPARRAQASSPAPTDGDNRFNALQHKLTTFAGAMDSAAGELEQLYIAMHSNADRANTLAGHLANADVDTKFVEMTNLVSTALGGATVTVGRLQQTTSQVAATAHEAHGTHSKLYSALNDVRSGRTEKSPKPGFLTR